MYHTLQGAVSHWCVGERDALEREVRWRERCTCNPSHTVHDSTAVPEPGCAYWRIGICVARVLIVLRHLSILRCGGVGGVGERDEGEEEFNHNVVIANKRRFGG